MESQQVDTKLLTLLNELPYFSKLGTSLSVRLSNYAAQLHSCRSIFQLDDSKMMYIEEDYSFLTKMLDYHIHKCIDYLSNSHEYRDIIYDLDDLSLELLLESTLFEMVVFDNYLIFTEQFFKGS